jgi:hypothetical protein
MEIQRLSRSLTHTMISHLSLFRLIFVSAFPTHTFTHVRIQYRWRWEWYWKLWPHGEFMGL